MTDNTVEDAASIIVIHRETGQVLSATRRNSKTEWGLIGGKKDAGETIEECAVREYEEETGLRLQSQPQWFFSGICRGKDGRNFNVRTFVVADLNDIRNAMDSFQSPREVEPGISVGFVDYSELINGPFGEYNAELLNRILKIFIKYSVNLLNSIEMPKTSSKRDQ